MAPRKEAPKKAAPKKSAPAVKVFTAWSFSRWNDWYQCPARARYKHLDKIITEEMAKKAADMRAGVIEEGPMERGAGIAKKAENYLTKKTSKLPIELMSLASTYRDIRKIEGLGVELGVGFTREWKPCSPTDWDRCWLRVKMDISWVETTKIGKAYNDVLHIRDNKTGRLRDDKAEEYMLQLDLYGTAGLALMPTVSSATAQLLYSDIGQIYPETPTVFPREKLESMQREWERRVRPMFADRRFAPRPGYYCRWCDFSKAKGGPCKY